MDVGTLVTVLAIAVVAGGVGAYFRSSMGKATIELLQTNLAEERALGQTRDRQIADLHNENARLTGQVETLTSGLAQGIAERTSVAVAEAFRDTLKSTMHEVVREAIDLARAELGRPQA